VPTLFVLRGTDKGQTFRPPRQPAVLGRVTADIPLTDESVSRRHAEIHPEDDNWILTDLGSSNGTYLNGVRVDRPIRLKHGDQIKMGATLLVFSGEPTEADFGEPPPQDSIHLERDSGKLDSAILSAVPSSEDSLILAAPETADAVHAWRVMYQLAELLGTGPGIDTFLRRVTDIICEHLVVDRVFVLMRQEQSGELVPVVVRPRPRSPTAITTSQTLINHVLRTREGVLCANAMTDERFSDAARSESIARLGLRSVICVPILAHDEVQGVIHFDCSMSHNTYTNEQLRLATAIGRMAGLAIENERLLQSRMAHERLAAVGQTVAHLSHYIRNILQGMRSGAEVVEMGLRRRTLETIESGWKIIQNNLDRTYQLTTNMLTFSRDRRPLIAPGRLNHAIEDAVHLLKRRAEERKVAVVTELAEDLPTVELDMEGMVQVTTNLLANALDAAPAERGRVVLRTRYDLHADRLTLTITDNGPGISPDKAEQIFDAFYSTKGHAGTGLGLAAARKIVNELGGQIEVQSRLNQGTTFHVHLPVRLPGLVDESAKTQVPTAP